MLWWSGLRGAIAFSLSLSSNQVHPAVRTTTLVICVVTVVFLGGGTPFMLKRLGIRTGVGNPERSFEREMHPSYNMEEEREAISSDSSDSESNDDSCGSSNNNSNIFTGIGRGRKGRGTGDSTHVSILNQSHHGAGHSGGTLPHRTEESDHMRVSFGGSSMIDDEESEHQLGILESNDEDATHWFISFDEKWLKPLFTRSHGISGHRSSHYSHQIGNSESGMGGGLLGRLSRVRRFEFNRLLSSSSLSSSPSS